MVKVSICIPSYKQVSFLKRCLDSIEKQTYSNYEIIISDDSPNDEIEVLIQEYAHLPIIYRQNRIALGSPENWNNAINMASGEYIKIMHHDDWFATTTSLEKFVKALDENTEAFFAFSACIDKGDKIEIKRNPLSFELKSLRKNPDILGLGNLIGAPSVTFFRNNKEWTFDNQFVWLVDIEFYIRLLRKHSSFVYIPDYLIHVGISENQITNQCKDDEQLIQKEYNYLCRKLNLKYNSVYIVYHTIKNEIIPKLKKIIRR